MSGKRKTSRNFAKNKEWGWFTLKTGNRKGLYILPAMNQALQIVRLVLLFPAESMW